MVAVMNADAVVQAQSDAEIIVRSREDSEVFGELFDRYSAMLLRHPQRPGDATGVSGRRR